MSAIVSYREEPPRASERLTAPLVVGFGGTLRPDSLTERALRKGLDAAALAGARTVFIPAAELEFPMYRHGGAGTAGSRRFTTAVREADGILIASPGYHGTVSGLLKNALDHLEDLRDDERPYLADRAVGCIVCADGWQATASTLASLRSTVHALRGWPTPLGVAINSTDRERDPAAHLEAVALQVVEFARMRRAA